jgi:hypothetical protein
VQDSGPLLSAQFNAAALTANLRPVILEMVRDVVGRTIGAVTKAVLKAPLLRTSIKIIPTPLRRQITRFGRRLRRLEAGPYPGQPRNLAGSTLPSAAIPFGYEIGQRNGIGIFDVDQRRPTRLPRREQGQLIRRFPSGLHLSDSRNARCDPEHDPVGFRRMVQRAVAIDDAMSTWPDHTTRARLLHVAAASGTPVVLGPDQGADELLPAGLVQAMRAADLASVVNDPELRDRIAWTQWRAARPEVTAVPVTILLATRRPEMITRWAPQIAAQTHRPISVSVAFHGAAFHEITKDQVQSLLGDIPVHITRCGDDMVLGQLLAAATAAATGELLIKWDDDDLYSTTHIAEMVSAWDTTGAMLVGKACDFVYLTGPDLTVRRIQAARESISRTMAGGTLTIAGSDLEALGGWDQIPSGVDVGLIARVQDAGGIAYRTMGYGYMMIREASGHGHTWSVDDAHFLVPTNPRQPGLAAQWAGIDAPAAVIEGVGLQR